MIQTNIGLLGNGTMSLVGKNGVDRVLMVRFPLNLFIKILKGYLFCWRDLVLYGSDRTFYEGRSLDSCIICTRSTQKKKKGKKGLKIEIFARPLIFNQYNQKYLPSVIHIMN